MSLVYERTQSGIIAARHNASADAVRAELKLLDPDLVLAEPDAVTPYWRVLKIVSRDQPAVPVCSWKDDDGTPLPLSRGLVEKVNSLRADGRVQPVDVDAENERVRARLEREADEYLDDAAGELVSRLRGRKLYCLPRGLYRRNTEFKDIRR